MTPAFPTVIPQPGPRINHNNQYHNQSSQCNPSLGHFEPFPNTCVWLSTPVLPLKLKHHSSTLLLHLYIFHQKQHNTKPSNLTMSSTHQDKPPAYRCGTHWHFAPSRPSRYDSNPCPWYMRNAVSPYPCPLNRTALAKPARLA